MNPKDFTNRKSFPGTTGNAFDLFLHLGDVVEKIPAIAFALLLVALASVTWARGWQMALAQYLFFVSDWLLLALLPRAGKSFGPAKPPTLLLALLRLPAAFLPPPWALVAQAIGTVLVGYGFWWEPHRLTLTRQTLRSGKFRGRRLSVLHLGDLHIERVTDRERQLIAMCRQLQPDLILFSGDFLNLSNVHDRQSWRDARAVLSQLDAPLGLYAVTGSPPVDDPDVVEQLLAGLPIRWLRDEAAHIDHQGLAFTIAGVTCTHKPFLDAPKVESLLAGVDANRFVVLLYHTPDLAPHICHLPIDLQLSGHTHGGQVRLPLYGAIFAGSLYGKTLEAGRKQLNGLTLYVTRGIGMEGKGAPRVRFLCPPEIILWTWVGEED